MTLTSALAGLMMLIVGGFMRSAIIIPNPDLSIRVIDLPITWQISALLLSSLVFTINSSIISSIAYIIIGIFFIPIFHGGGSSGYLMTPEFGYLIGFIPAALVTSSLTTKRRRKNYFNLFLISLTGLSIIHIIGIINISIGALTNRWSVDFLTMIFSYSLAPLPFHLLLCTSIALLARISRILMLK